MRKWIPILTIIAAVMATLMLYSRLPDQVATHWSATGEVNGWSSRFWGAWLMPLMMAVMLIILRAVPHIDPRKANYEKFSGMYENLVIIIIAFMALIHVLVLLAATGRSVPMDRIIMPSVGVFMAAIGFLIPRAAPNWFIGIRTPWTLTSDLAWEKTHRLGGPMFVALGALMVAATFIAPGIAIWVLVAAAIGITIFLFAYSYRVWKTDPLKR